MTAVQVSNIKVLNNPCGFLEPFQFEITFEATQELEEDLEWRVTYVGSADSEAYDQVLDSVLVGPVPLGTNRFVFEAPAPDPNKIPSGDLLGVTVVLVECLYREKVFVRVGYYVSNENPDDPAPVEHEGNSRMEADVDGMDVEDLEGESDGDAEADPEDDMDDVDMVKENVELQAETSQNSAAFHKKTAVEIPPSKIRRFILDDKPRVTRFPIEWDNAKNQQQQSLVVDSSGMMMSASSSATVNAGF